MAPVIAALRAADPEGAPRPRPHRSALRPDDVGHLPRAARRAGARPHAGGRLRDAGGTARRDRRAIAPVLEAEQPDLVIVPGDVNSTLAAALACAHLRIPIAHVEAGLRSFDRTMPEEVNRVLTDQISDLLFTHSPEAEPNLVDEGIDRDRVRLVGNTMIDSLVALEGRFRERRACAELRARARLLPARHAAPAGPRRRVAAGAGDRAARRGLARRCRSCSRSTRAPGPRSGPPPASSRPASA